MYGRPIPAVNPFWGRPALANGRGRGGAAAVFATAEPTVITPLVYPSHPVLQLSRRDGGLTGGRARARTEPALRGGGGAGGGRRAGGPGHIGCEMAIENEDWLYLGGAAIGGIALGALGYAALRRGQEIPDVDIVTRRYRHAEMPGLDIEADVLADFAKGAVVLEVVHPEDGGIALSRPDETFLDAEEAAGFMDEWAKKHDFRPVGPWRSDALEGIGAEPEGVVAVSGRRRG